MRIIVAVTLLVVASSALSIACGGGGGEPTIEGYFQEFLRIEEESNQKLEDVNPEYQERLGSIDNADTLEEGIAAVQEGLSLIADLARQARDAYMKLDPPAEVQDAHDDWVTLFVSLVKVQEDVIDSFAEVESMSELSDLVGTGLGTDELLALVDEADAACRLLQGFARANQVAAPTC